MVKRKTKPSGRPPERPPRSSLQSVAYERSLRSGASLWL